VVFLLFLIVLSANHSATWGRSFLERGHCSSHRLPPVWRPCTKMTRIQTRRFDLRRYDVGSPSAWCVIW
jgi:hypothetical protein